MSVLKKRRIFCSVFLLFVYLGHTPKDTIMKDMTMWCTYHEDIQIEQYHLREDDAFRLFKGNASDVVGGEHQPPECFLLRNRHPLLGVEKQYKEQESWFLPLSPKVRPDIGRGAGFMPGVGFPQKLSCVPPLQVVPQLPRLLRCGGYPQRTIR